MNAPLETTMDLVERSHAGDATARDRLLARYLPILTRWARGRLPSGARDLSETSDLVQVTLLRAFQHLPSFQAQGPGAFFAFLRQIMSNLLKDELRRVGRRPQASALNEHIVDEAPLPLAQTMTVETLRAYEAALSKLSDDQREVVVMRVELGMAHDEIAAATESPSANAARMRVARALADLARNMSDFKD